MEAWSGERQIMIYWILHTCGWEGGTVGEVVIDTVNKATLDYFETLFTGRYSTWFKGNTYPVLFMMNKLWIIVNFLHEFQKHTAHRRHTFDRKCVIMWRKGQYSVNTTRALSLCNWVHSRRRVRSIRSVQSSSRCYLCARKSPSALYPCLSQKFNPNVVFETVTVTVSLIDRLDGPLMSLSPFRKNRRAERPGHRHWSDEHSKDNARWHCCWGGGTTPERNWLEKSNFRSRRPSSSTSAVSPCMTPRALLG